LYSCGSKSLIKLKVKGIIIILLLLGEEGARGEKEYFFVIHNLVVVSMID